MKLLYESQSDKDSRHLIYYAVWDADVLRFSHTTNIPLSETRIDETSENKDALQKLSHVGPGPEDENLFLDQNGNIVDSKGAVLPVTVDQNRDRLQELKSKADAGTITSTEQTEAVKLLMGDTLSTK